MWKQHFSKGVNKPEAQRDKDERDADEEESKRFEAFVLSKKVERLSREISEIDSAYSPEVREYVLERDKILHEFYDLIEEVKRTKNLELVKQKDNIVDKLSKIEENLDVRMDDRDILFQELKETTQRLSKLRGGKRKRKTRRSRR